MPEPTLTAYGLAELRQDGPITPRHLADAEAQLRAEALRPPLTRADILQQIAWNEHEVRRDERRLAQGQKCEGQLERGRASLEGWRKELEKCEQGEVA